MKLCVFQMIKFSRQGGIPNEENSEILKIRIYSDSSETDASPDIRISDLTANLFGSGYAG